MKLFRNRIGTVPILKMKYVKSVISFYRTLLHRCQNSFLTVKVPSSPPRGRYGINIDLKMKLSAVLLIFGIVVIQANSSYSQKKISLNLENVTVERLLDEIESKTDFRFIYNTDDVDVNRRVSVVAEQQSVALILKNIFANTKTDFTIDNGQIFLLAKKTPTPEKKVTNNQGTIRITGKVTDAAGSPLPGVAVVLKGTKNGVATDFDGNYAITVPGPESILVFTSMGFDDKEVAVGNQQIINITLQEAVSQLDEVVVSTGYWKEERKLSTGNIGKIDAKVIERQPVINPLEALQGQVAGVQIQQTSGIPGDGININIRGLNSLNNGQTLIGDGGVSVSLPNANLPFFVIDGVPFTGSSLNSEALGGNGLPGGNPLASIQPNDIESIEVLKDADATAIYGSRGANGVVLITTKKGQVGKLKVDLDYSMGIGEVPNKVDLLNTEQYLMMRREAVRNDGNVLRPSDSLGLTDVFVWDPNRYTDWQEVLVGGTAERTNTNVTISGGTEQTQFLIRGGHIKQTNVLRFDDSAFRSTSGLFNLTHRSKDNRFNINLSTTYTAVTNNQAAPRQMRRALTLAPNAPELFDDEGNLNFENGFLNPLAFTEVEYENNTRTFVTNLNLGYEIFKGLRFNGSFGYTDSRVDETTIEPLSSLPPEDREDDGISRLANGNQETWIIEPKLEYFKKIGESKIDILIGTTLQGTNTNRITVTGSGYDSDLLIRDIGRAPMIEVDASSFTEYRYVAIYGRINYNYRDKYILNLTGRRDGSSRFGPNRRFGNFGALGAAWVFSEESFLKNASVISFGKIRGSFGLTGNDQIGDYEFLDTFGAPSNGFNYNNTSSLVVTRAANPSFSWEENKKLEFGLELGFFKNRIRLNTSWFQNRTDNQLIGRPLSAVTGFSSVQFNLPALVENKGIEVELNSVNIRGDDFQWATAFNITRLRNKLVEFPDIESFSPFDNQLVVGRSLFGRKQYKSLGVDPQTGAYTIVDINGDGQIGPQDRQDFVETFQDFFGGLNNSFRWKGLQLDIFFRFVKQNARSFISNFNVPGASISGQFDGNRPIQVLNRWQSPGDVTSIQRFSRLLFQNNTQHNSSGNAIVDASFIRLQNVSLSWTLPSKWTEQMGIDKLRFYANGQNLVTFTNYNGLDAGTLSSSLPPLRMIITGIQLTF